MKKTAVIYQSKYGHTQKYAAWLSEALKADLLPARTVKPQQMAEYDIIIFGGGLYAGGLNGSKLLTENFSVLQNKAVIVFTCGLADPANKTNTEHIKESLKKTFTADMTEKIKFFHLRSGINYAELGIVHKAMMAMLYHNLQKAEKETLTDEDKELIATYGQTIDFTDQAALAPIIEYAAKLQKS